MHFRDTTRRAFIAIWFIDTCPFISRSRTFAHFLLVTLAPCYRWFHYHKSSCCCSYQYYSVVYRSLARLCTFVTARGISPTFRSGQLYGYRVLSFGSPHCRFFVRNTCSSIRCHLLHHLPSSLPAQPIVYVLLPPRASTSGGSSKRNSSDSFEFSSGFPLSCRSFLFNQVFMVLGLPFTSIPALHLNANRTLIIVSSILSLGTFVHFLQAFRSYSHYL